MHNILKTRLLPPHSDSQSVASESTARHDGSQSVPQRKEWIDCMRGITMLLVIITHCEFYLTSGHSSFSDFCVVFRMPLFFFISGYFAYSQRLKFSAPGKVIEPIRRRLLGVIVPTMVFCALFSILLISIENTSISDILHDKYKGGYWFTLVSFEIFIICIPLVFIANVNSIKRSIKILVFLSVMILFAYLRDYIVADWRNHPFVEVMSLEFTFEYLPYFALGILTRINEKFLTDSLARWWTIIALAAIYIIASSYAPQLKFGTQDMRFLPFISIILICIFLIFYKLRNLFNRSNHVGQALSHIGRNTLQIYLMHYFIVIFFTIGSIQIIFDWKSLNLDHVFPITVCVSLLIIAICLGVDKLLKRLHIRHLFFPKYK